MKKEKTIRIRMASTDGNWDLMQKLIDFFFFNLN